jgi:hypothetical protein
MNWNVIRCVGHNGCYISSQYSQNPTEGDFALLKEADTNLRSQKEESFFFNLEIEEMAGEKGRKRI